MPRRRPRDRVWRPLPLAHDTTAHSDHSQQEEDLYMREHDLGVSDADFVVFVETLETLTHPRMLEDYTLDLFSQQAAKICLLKVAGNDDRQPIAMSLIDDIPAHATAEVLGTCLKLPPGPDHLRRLIFFRTHGSVFFAVLWCPYDRNWSHVATYRTKQDKIRICIRPGDWNQSTAYLLNSHATQFLGLRRLHRIATGMVARSDDFSVERIYTDPIEAARQLEEVAVVHPVVDMPVLETATTHSYEVPAPTDIERCPVAPPPGFLQQPPTGPRGFVPPGFPSVMTHAPYAHEYYGPQYNTMDMPYGYPGAVQWPQEHGYMPDFQPQYMPQPQYHNTVGFTPQQYNPYTPDKKQDGPDDTTPTATRTVLRNTVVRLTEQAKERNKNPKEYRTVLYDPYRAENKAPLRGAAPPYVQTPTPAPAVKSVGDPMKRTDSKTEASVPALQREPEVSELASMTLEHSSPDSQWQSMPPQTIRILRPSMSTRYTVQNFRGPFFAADLESPLRTQPRSQDNSKTHDEKINDWWWSGSQFARQEELYQRLVATDKGKNPVKDKPEAAFDLPRLLIPMLENLSAYVDRPPEQSRDYFSRWIRAPEWCCDRSAEGAKSFFDKDWGCPPARIGRDPRYQPMPREPRYVNRFGIIGSRGGRFGRA